jgi:hypothetical protein
MYSQYMYTSDNQIWTSLSRATFLQFLPGLETECDLNSLDDSKLVRLVQYVNSKQLILQVSNYGLHGGSVCKHQTAHTTGE